MVRDLFKKTGKRKRAQASLEMSIALILAAMLMIGAAKIFVWLNGNMVLRQKRYEDTRVSAGSQPHQVIASLDGTDVASGAMSTQSDYPALNLF
jgi:uncharacterized protein (UPF0333 family)